MVNMAELVTIFVAAFIANCFIQQPNDDNGDSFQELFFF